MKTIFIPAYHGFVSRAVFASDALGDLKKHNNVRVVIFGPSSKKEYFEKWYGGPNVVVEGFNVEELIRTKSNKFWYRLAFLLQNSQYVIDQRKERLWNHSNPAGYLNYWLINSLAWVLSHLGFVRSLYRWADFRYSPKNAFTPYIEKYKPDLMFSSDVFCEQDALFMRSAKIAGIKTLGMVRSWDNTTTKGILRVFPDRLLVNSQAIADEIVKWHSYSRNLIQVVGLPQFDRWVVGPTLSREEFMNRLSIPLDRRIIMFAPAGANMSTVDGEMCDILKQAVDEGNLPDNVQVLVRNHPAHPADLSKFTSNDRFTIEHPGKLFGAVSYREVELAPDDNEHLRNCVYHCDIIMYIATSLGLDALVYDKPAIIVSFDGCGYVPYVKSIRRFNDEDCLHNLALTGCTKVAKSATQWIKQINDYLKNSSIDSAGRAFARKRYMEPMDGNSGHRIATEILKKLEVS